MTDKVPQPEPSTAESSVPADAKVALLPHEAFEHFWMQGIHGEERSLALTAHKFGVPLAQVRRWFRQYKWRDRINNRARKIAEKMDERAVEKVVAIKQTYHNMLGRIIRDWFSERFLKDPDQKSLTLSMVSPDDLIKLIKLDLVLMGQPDTIRQIEQGTSEDAEDNVKKLTTDDLRAIIDARRKQLAATNATVTIEATPVVLRQAAQEELPTLPTEEGDPPSAPSD